MSPTRSTVEVVELAGTAGDLHARPLVARDEPGALVEVCRIERPALVLGSTQPDEVADRAAAEAQGFDVARRRSGGGAVRLDPAHSVWIDVTIGRADPRWRDDVNATFHPVGRAWARALVALAGGTGATAPTVHAGGLERTPWSGLVCFAGVGPGEVVLDGRKVVGLSQRRTRGAARVQGLAELAGGSPAGAIVDLLAQPAEAAERAALRGHLDRTVGPVTAPSAGALVDALVDALRAP